MRPSAAAPGISPKGSAPQAFCTWVPTLRVATSSADGLQPRCAVLEWPDEVEQESDSVVVAVEHVIAYAVLRQFARLRQ